MDLTEHGKKMAKFPLDPTFAHLLLQSPKYGCIKEMLSAVAMLSTENVFYLPGGGNEDIGKSAAAAKAADCHRRFKSYEGDLPTLLAVYQSWQREAIYIPSSAGGRKAQKKQLKAEIGAKGGKSGVSARILHGDWCNRNFISGRSLTRAYDIRKQIEDICSRPSESNGLGWDVGLSCGTELETFLKCACAGLFLKVATRIPSSNETKRDSKAGKSSASSFSTRRYRTTIGGQEVFIHPTSSLFGRNPAPKSVVFTELLITKKTYIRGVTQIKEDWLPEVAPHLFARS